MDECDCPTVVVCLERSKASGAIIGEFALLKIRRHAREQQEQQQHLEKSVHSRSLNPKASLS